MGGAWALPRRCSRPVRATRAAVLSVMLAAVAVSPAALAESRVVSGSLAKQGSYPFVAAILSAGIADPFAAQFCGAAVVASRIVITAAHCVDSHPAIDVLVNTNRPQYGSRDRKHG